MVDSQGTSSPLTPAELVGKRLEEHRLFEARFLFDKMAQAIEPAAREQLQQQMKARISKAERLFARGLLLEKAGELAKALKLYAEVATLAVDYPNLDQVRQRVEVALSLGSLYSYEPSGVAPGEAEPSSGGDGEVVVKPFSQSWFSSHKIFRKKILVPLLSGVVCLVLITLWLHHVPAEQASLPVEKHLEMTRLPEEVVPPEVLKSPQKLTQIQTLKPSEPLATAEPIQSFNLSEGGGVSEQRATRKSPPVEAVVSEALKATESSSKQRVSEQPEEEHPTSPESGEDANNSVVDEKPTQTPPPSQVYTVQQGDTLETIAKKVYGKRYKWSRLVRANQDKLGHSPYVLSVGMCLQVPPLAEEEAPVLNDDGTYTVQSGDSLGSIAGKVYGSSRKWETLYGLNRDQLPTPGALQVGQKLRITKKDSGAEGKRSRGVSSEDYEKTPIEKDKSSFETAAPGLKKVLQAVP